MTTPKVGQEVEINYKISTSEGKILDSSKTNILLNL